MTNTHNTAPTQFINANGVRYAYRWFGTTSGTRVVFLQHFRGGLDNWDPKVTDGLAKDRPVILFNNAGVASSGGEPADTVSDGKVCRHLQDAPFGSVVMRALTKMCPLRWRPCVQRQPRLLTGARSPK